MKNAQDNTQKGYLVNAFAAAAFVTTSPAVTQTNRIAVTGSTTPAARANNM